MVYRVYVEKKQGFQHEANSLLQEVRDLLEIKSVENIRVINSSFDLNLEISPKALCKTSLQDNLLSRFSERLSLSRVTNRFGWFSRISNENATS